MDEITVGVLTISDSCFRKDAVDESGENLVMLIEGGVLENASVVKVGLVPDSKEDITMVLTSWCDEGIHLILTTGGTGIAERDVTPEAVVSVLHKAIPGISYLLFQESLKATPLAALSRSIAGIREKSLIISLPGSKKASQECLEAVAKVIPHAIDLIKGNTDEIKHVHASLGQKKSLVVADNKPDRKRQCSYSCVSVSVAQEVISSRLYLLRKQKVVGYNEALGYVLNEDAIALDDLPPFACSTRDGYAVLSSDKMLNKKVIGISKAGDSLLGVTVTPGSCVRISTGAALPPGADAVVQIEDTLTKSDLPEDYVITLNNFPVKGQNIREIGSDFKRGEVLLTYNTYLDSAAVGLLAAAGLTSVRVFDKPVVAVMSTGNEIVNPIVSPKPGQVRDSNKVTLLSLLKEENLVKEVLDLGIVQDNPNALRDALERGFRMADVVVTTGSLSMGEQDYLKEVIQADFKGEILFERVMMKPGKPTSLAIVSFQEKAKLWLGLPGNPASTFVTSHLFLLPALRKISGWGNIFPQSIKVKLNDIIPLEERPQYARAVLTYNDFDRWWTAKVIGNQSSSNIRNCIGMSCLLELPAAPPKQETTSPPEPKTSHSTHVSSLPKVSTAFGTQVPFSSHDSTQNMPWNYYNRDFNVARAEKPSFATSTTPGFAASEVQQNPKMCESGCVVKAFLIGKCSIRA